jgi:multicomponent Na+:H+ antiporter subunit D
MWLGLGLGSALAMAASIFYMIQGILVKALLFLIIGIVEKRGGSSELSKLGGLYRSSPGFSILYLLAALALIGIPPLSGFWAKLMVLEAGVEHQAWWIISVVLLASLLTFIPLMRIWFEAFWKDAPENNTQSPSDDAATLATTEITSQTHPLQVVPVLGLSAILLLIGLAPASLISLADKAAAGVIDVETYLNVVLEPSTPPNLEIKP